MRRGATLSSTAMDLRVLREGPPTTHRRLCRASRLRTRRRSVVTFVGEWSGEAGPTPRRWPLTAVRQAATDNAKVLLIEGILPETFDTASLTLDVIMLAVTGGRERTTKGLSGLLNASGFQLMRVTDTTGRLRIAEAVLAKPDAVS